MKKLLLTLVLVISSLTAGAQVYLGGEVGLWRDWNNNETTFALQPEIGYQFSDKWAAGLQIGYAHHYNDGAKINAFNFPPYARYTVGKVGIVSFIVDGGFGFSSLKEKNSDSATAWEIGLKPGVKVQLAPQLHFVAHLGFLGYRDNDHGALAFGSQGLGFAFSSQDLKFGLLYEF